MKQNKDREEFEKMLENKTSFSKNGSDYEHLSWGYNDEFESDEEVEAIWSWIESYTKKKVEEYKTEIFKDLIKIADAGELEDLRREVTCYFKSKQQERLRKICEKNKDDMTGLYDYDGIVSGVLSILEEEQK